MVREGYEQFGARHAESGALRNLLAHLGVRAPHTGQPLSEAMLFGVAGGIGLAYFALELNQSKAIYLGTRIHTKEGERPEFLQAACDRLGLRVRVEQTGSPKAAEAQLAKALGAGLPVIVWTDLVGLPDHPYLTPTSFYHPLVVYRMDGERVCAAGRYEAPLVLTRGELAAARQSEWVPKHRMLVIEGATQWLNYVDAARDGMRVTCEHLLNPPMAHFGLKALDQLADGLTNGRDKKGWPRLFPPGPDLVMALFALYDQIESRGEGGALRGMYADFLTEAATLLWEPRLLEAAEGWREAAERWRRLAESALPGAVPQFAEVKCLVAEKRAMTVMDGAARAALEPVNARLAVLKDELAAEFPMTGAEVGELLDNLRGQVEGIRAVEARAIAELSAIVN